MYSEKDITWSTIEKFYQYNKVYWHTGKDGIPIYTLIDENENKIDISIEVF